MTKEKANHQFIDRETSSIRTEKFYGDWLVRFLYDSARENASFLFKASTSARASALLGYLNFDLPFGNGLFGMRRFCRSMGVDLSECVDAPESLTTPRKIFERKIRYWETRPQEEDSRAVVSPADSRMVVGSLEKISSLYIKDKFFSLGELLGLDKGVWLESFTSADFAIFRLTPDKYHYNHTPVAGLIEDYYEIPGAFHSCNPDSVVALATPYSKNRRFVTILDTDVPGGTAVGLVAVIEVVALMIGNVVQCYSESRYDDPKGMEIGMFMEKGRPKSLFRPGSSTDVVLFQRGRIDFAGDIVRNMNRCDVESRFSRGFGKSLTETDVKVRTTIAHAKQVGNLVAPDQ
jgi:phosphatidylserine decarboxylase